MPEPNPEFSSNTPHIAQHRTVSTQDPTCPFSHPLTLGSTKEMRFSRRSGSPPIPPPRPGRMNHSNDDHTGHVKDQETPCPFP